MGQQKIRHKVPGEIGWQRAWTTEGRRAILWLPVLMGCGIWLYFAFDREPNAEERGRHSHVETPFHMVDFEFRLRPSA